MTGPVLIYADHAGVLAEGLRPRFPDETILAVDQPEALAEILATHRPEIAFSIRSAHLVAETHRQIRDTPSLRWYHVGGSGYEHLLGWETSRLTVTNGAGVLAPFLAETVIGALTSINCGLIRYHAQQHEKIWQSHPFRPLAGQSLLIVGAGAIGAQVARRASALGMHVVGLRRAPEPVDGVDEMRPLDALMESLADADVASVHLRLTPETEGLFDAAKFAAMKPGGILINTARGGHVVEADLIEALVSGKLRAAYLDVFATEPLPADSPLWAAPNLLISPHASDGVEDWEARFAALFAENLACWRAGRPMQNIVPG